MRDAPQLLHVALVCLGKALDGADNPDACGRVQPLSFP